MNVSSAIRYSFTHQESSGINKNANLLESTRKYKEISTFNSYTRNLYKDFLILDNKINNCLQLLECTNSPYTSIETLRELAIEEALMEFWDVLGFQIALSDHLKISVDVPALISTMNSLSKEEALNFVAQEMFIVGKAIAEHSKSISDGALKEIEEMKKGMTLIFNTVIQKGYYNLDSQLFDLQNFQKDFSFDNVMAEKLLIEECQRLFNQKKLGDCETLMQFTLNHYPSAHFQREKNTIIENLQTAHSILAIDQIRSIHIIDNDSDIIDIDSNYKSNIDLIKYKKYEINILFKKYLSLNQMNFRLKSKLFICPDLINKINRTQVEINSNQNKIERKTVEIFFLIQESIKTKEIQLQNSETKIFEFKQELSGQAADDKIKQSINMTLSEKNSSADYDMIAQSTFIPINIGDNYPRAVPLNKNEFLVRELEQELNHCIMKRDELENLIEERNYVDCTALYQELERCEIIISEILQALG